MSKTKQDTTTNKLATKNYWSEEWGLSKPLLTFNPNLTFFKEIHKELEKHLPKDDTKTCLEIGCYPGTYMWYFNHFFKYKISGIEYLDNYIEKCRANMSSLNVDAEIIHADLFEYTAPHNGWDVVASFGFIEHFKDTELVIKKHLDMVKPGGYLVLVIPNHAGFNGKILKAIDPKRYKIHNHMSYEQMKNDLLKNRNVKILKGGYMGHIGFWNCALYDYLGKKGKLVYLAARAPLYILEKIGQYIVPNSKTFSPNSVIIAKKD